MRSIKEYVKKCFISNNISDIANKRFSVRLYDKYEYLWNEFGSRTGFKISANDKLACIHGIIEDDLIICSNSELNQEAYRIDVSDKQIRVTAPAIEGLWRGMNTLATLLKHKEKERISCGWIEDWPSLPLRGAHLDLTFVMYTPGFLMSLLPRFSSMSINTILLDISDKLIFPKLEFMAHPDALTVDFWKKFESEAHRWFIEIIPVVQTFGHMGNYLKHQQIQSLREKTDSTAVLCPSNDESLDFIANLIDGAKIAFPSCKLIHAGLDEVGYEGQCPNCRHRYARLGYSGVYREHIIKVRKLIHGHGVRMMMWADMLIAYPEVCNDLPLDIIINDWQYLRFGKNEKNWFVFTGARTPDMQASGGLDDLVEKFPADLFKVYDSYIGSGEKELPFKSYPYTKYFMDKGFSVIGSPAVKCFGSHFITPMYDKRLPNVVSFSETLAECGAAGVINTNWSPRGTHALSGSMAGYWAGALAAWTGRCTDKQLNSYLAEWLLPGYRKTMNEYRIIGQQILPLTNYGWMNQNILR